MIITDMQRQYKIYALAIVFYKAHREVYPSRLNTEILACAADAQEMPQTIESWEQIYSDPEFKSRLEQKPVEVIPEPEGPKYPVPPAGLQKYGTFRNLADARKLIPGSVFRDLMYDKNSKGLPSEKSLAFKAWLTELQTYEGGR